MKKLYILISLMLASTFMYAQRTDEDINKEIILYREFNPTLNDAEKINLEPSIYKTKKVATQSQYLESAPQYKGISRNIAQITPGNVYRGEDVVEQNAYIKFGAGNYGNINGVAGARIKTTETGELNVWGSFLGTSSKAKYMHYDINKLSDDKIKAKSGDLNIHLDYKHGFQASTLEIGANYRYLGFNYYGSPFISDKYLTESDMKDRLSMFDFEQQQKVNIININALLFSNETKDNANALRYSGNAGFTTFSSKYGYMPAIDNGPKGGIINGGVDFALQLNEEYVGYLGIRGDVLFQYYNNREKYEPTDGMFSNLFHIKANPYYTTKDDFWSVEVGMNIEDVRNFKKNKVYLSPNIKGQITVSDFTTLYLTVGGGVKDNTYVEMMDENKYISLYNGIKHSHTQYDLQLGVKSGVIEGVELGVFGGYKSTDDAMFYINGGDDHYSIGSTTKYWSNQATPTYYKSLRTGNIGANVSTTLIPYTTLALTAKSYFYSAKNDLEIFNRPKFETILSADINPIQNLTLSAMYILQTGRKGAVSTNTNALGLDVYDMKNVFELNVGAEYNIVKEFSIFAKVNNLFNQKYEDQPGYRLQGINILGGFALKF